MPGSVCISGEVVRLPDHRRVSGATHLLRDQAGRALVLLRSRVVSLDLYEGKRVRVRGHARGRVLTEEAPTLEVTDLTALDRVPLRPGLDPTALGACVVCPDLPVRPFVGL